MMNDNYDYSKALLYFCHDHKVPFVYASSASVYGGGQVFREAPENERPLNVYGFSKLMFDRFVRRRLPLADCQVVGLRYFNVYGPNEAHKGSMASVAYHFDRQIEEELAKVKDRLAELQNDKKAALLMYDATCKRLGISNDLEDEDEIEEG